LVIGDPYIQVFTAWTAKDAERTLGRRSVADKVSPRCHQAYLSLMLLQATVCGSLTEAVRQYCVAQQLLTLTSVISTFVLSTSTFT
jgi:hypothetical protein